MKKYRSKIGIGIALFLLIILGGSATLMITQKVWIGLAIVLVVVGFTGYVFLSTYYIIQEQYLIIRCGFWTNKSIKIDTIRKIKRSDNPISSPANSLDRLNIQFDRAGSILISPVEKNTFINDLKAINPEIEVELN